MSSNNETDKSQHLFLLNREKVNFFLMAMSLEHSKKSIISIEENFQVVDNGICSVPSDLQVKSSSFTDDLLERIHSNTHYQ